MDLNRLPTERLVAPLHVPIGKKKKFLINLNGYRNAHYFTLNKAKQEYKALMRSQILHLPVMNRIQVSYKLFPKTKRRMDLGNLLSIQEKFFLDALVEFERIEDDTYEYITRTTYLFGKVDRTNPRVEISIHTEE